MIATVYEMEIKEQLNSEFRTEQRIALVNLYEIFIERKLQIYLTEKQKADTTNPSAPDYLENLKQIYLTNFVKCALIGTLTPPMLKSLQNRKIEEDIRPFLVKIQTGKEKKTGIIMNVVDGKPQFIYRTFAEYFRARWFSRNFKFNRGVLERIFLTLDIGS